MVTLLLLRFERHRQAGGDPDFDKFLMSLEDLLDFLPDDSGTFRERRSGSSKAAQEKREQAAKAKDKIQAYKLAASSMEGIDFQVLFPLAVTLS